MKPSLIDSAAGAPGLPPGPDSKSFTREEFLAEMQISSFLGMYKFWERLNAFHPADRRLRRYGDAIVRAYAELVWRLRPQGPQNPQEEEAFRYCGMPPPFDGSAAGEEK